MKKLIYTLSILAISTACSNGEEPVSELAKEQAAIATSGASAQNATAVTNEKKYTLKSGTVTFETSMNAGGTTIKSRKVLYFDDYGNKESQEEFTTNPVSGKEALSSVHFVKDGYMYTYSPEYKTGSRSKLQGQGVEMKFDMNEAETMKDKKFQKLSDQQVCGKDCQGYSIETPSGVMQVYGWNNIMLKNKLSGNGMSSETIAVKFEENTTIPAGKFEVPADVKITDI